MNFRFSLLENFFDSFPTIGVVWRKSTPVLSRSRPRNNENRFEIYTVVRLISKGFHLTSACSTRLIYFCADNIDDPEHGRYNYVDFCHL